MLNFKLYAQQKNDFVYFVSLSQCYVLIVKFVQRFFSTNFFEQFPFNKKKLTFDYLFVT